MRKSIKTTALAAIFIFGYAVGFLACGAAYAKAEEQPAAINESADVVHMDQVAGIKATEYGVYLTFTDGTGYWWEY